MTLTSLISQEEQNPTGLWTTLSEDKAGRSTQEREQRGKSEEHNNDRHE